MIRKDFKQGDIIVATSHRDPLMNGINDLMWVCRFERDLELSEAIELHYKKVKSDWPGLKINKKDVEEVIKDGVSNGEKYFLTTSGDVLSYGNHELADIFDIRYLAGEDIDNLVIEKDKWIRDNNISHDEDGHCRCYDGLEDIMKKVANSISTEPFDVEMRRIGL